MKNSIIRLFAFILISGCTIVSTNAQQQAKMNQPKSNMTPEQRVDKRLEKMKAELNLTNEQVPKVKEVLMARENMREAKAGSGNPHEAKDTRKQMMDDLGKILTPDQMTKFEQMQGKGRNKMQGNAPNENQPAK